MINNDKKNCCVERNQTNLSCHYSSRYQADYEYEGNYYCIFHYPDINHQEKESAINDELINGHYSFSYLKCGNFSFSEQHIVFPRYEICVLSKDKKEDISEGKIYVSKNEDRLEYKTIHNGFNVDGYVDLCIKEKLTSLVLNKYKNKIIKLITEKNCKSLLPMLYFDNCEIFRLHVENCNIFDVRLFNSNVSDIELKNVKLISNFIFKDSSLVRSVNFEKTHSNLILFSNVLMTDMLKDVINPFSSQFNLNFSDCISEEFRVIGCKISKQIEIVRSKFNEIDIINNKFYRFPRICVETLSTVQYFNLPEKEDIDYSSALNFGKKFFNFKQIIKLLNVTFSARNNKKDKRDRKNRISIFFVNECKKISLLYKFSKERGSHFSESNYYYYIKYCLEKSGNQKLIENIISKLYRITSDYGENIQKSFFYLLMTFLIFTAVYFMAIFYFDYFNGLDQENNLIVKSLLMSANQIVKPFSLMTYSSHIKNMLISSLSFINSILALSLVAELLIAIIRKFKNK